MNSDVPYKIGDEVYFLIGVHTWRGVITKLKTLNKQPFAFIRPTNKDYKVFMPTTRLTREEIVRVN